MEEHEQMTDDIFDAEERPRTNLAARDFHATYPDLPARYEKRHIELRHWLTALHNATGGSFIVYMDPESPGVKP